MKLTDKDFNSETRSIYKLDPNAGANEVSSVHGSAAVERKADNLNIEQFFAGINLSDRAQILQKLIQIRTKK